MGATDLLPCALGRVVMLGAALVAHTVAAQPATDCERPLEQARRADSEHFALLYRTIPARIEVSAHFALEIVVCARPGMPAAQALHISARMPEHGHGMNYTPSAAPRGPGRFRAEGLMFHMSGRWELVFAIAGQDVQETVRVEIVLP